MTPKWCWPHSLSSILNRVQLFLTEANKASVPISSTIVNEFGEACKQAFIKQFSEEREKEFQRRQAEEKAGIRKTPEWLQERTEKHLQKVRNVSS